VKNKIWTTNIPEEEGWYWVKYNQGYSVTRPAYLFRMKTERYVSVKPYNGPSFFAGPNHGGPKLKYLNENGKVVIAKSLRFGPKIEVPE
jgi:hypothetical protein